MRTLLFRGCPYNITEIGKLLFLILKICPRTSYWMEWEVLFFPTTEPGNCVDCFACDSLSNQSLSFHTENGTFWAFEVDEQSAYVIEFHARMSFCPAALETAFMRVGCWWRRKRAWKLRFYYISESVKAWTAQRRILCPRFSTATHKPLTLSLCQS